MTRFNSKFALVAALLVAGSAVASASGSSTVLDVAKEKGNFTTLAKAIEVAGLQSALTAQGPVTIFAPTDEAFAKLPPAQLEALLRPENKDQLAAILTYHVVPAKVMAADVKTGEAPSVNGKKLALKADKTGVTVNGAKVVAADLVGSNGVVHVVDTVILP